MWEGVKVIECLGIAYTSVRRTIRILLVFLRSG